MSCMNSCCKRWGQRLACSNNRCYLETSFLVSRHMYSNYCLYALCCCWFRSHDSHRDTFLLWESERLCYEMIHPFSFSFRRVLQLRLTSWARWNNVLKSPVKQQCACVRERVCGSVCLCVCVYAVEQIYWGKCIHILIEPLWGWALHCSDNSQLLKWHSVGWLARERNVGSKSDN